MIGLHIGGFCCQVGRLSAVMGLIGLQAACSEIPNQARRQLIGFTRADMVSCAGIPDQDEIRDGQEIMVWRQDRPVQGPLDLKTPFSFDLSLGEGTARATSWRLYETVSLIGLLILVPAPHWRDQMQPAVQLRGGV
ncbi:hypothetical protein [Acetobacter sp.]|jgi:hypothetical protein|uniref:hypothetical protein n=1 Tax=Acetobacter sp. TaxID=440 RepID=UPI0025C361FD|nr:hypothetical protein [Acetobacter sp.]MCH4091222.1 hypothetical protein [Acetobacter sp.]MCI1300883.1 hypothetical protein [Acetobacter sp.]MCI1317211.1 hypothetical protein [Acetobacter sp.]